MKSLLRNLALTTALAGFTAPALADAPNVVVTIKPVHSLVAAIMDGVGEPELLITGAASPHDFSLKPSEARSLQEAGLVVWVGEDLESFMPNAISGLAKNATILELMDVEGLHILKNREGGVQEHHDDHKGHDDHGHDDHADHKGHDDHGHDDHADHKGHDDHGHDDHADHKGHDDHGHDDHADHKGHDEHDHDDHADHKGHDDHDHDDHADHKGHDDHGHDDHHGHHHGEFDPHIWLDTHNAEVMAGAIAAALQAADPENKAKYAENLTTLLASLEGLEGKIKQEMAALKDGGFVTFHDAYQYFEHQFGIETSGILTINPAIKPGAARITEIRHELEEGKISCIFAEPQFPARIFNALTDGLDVNIGKLDPLGADLEAGPAMYPALLQGLADDMKACLK